MSIDLSKIYPIKYSEKEIAQRFPDEGINLNNITHTVVVKVYDEVTLGTIEYFNSETGLFRIKKVLNIFTKKDGLRDKTEFNIGVGSIYLVPETNMGTAAYRSFIDLSNLYEHIGDKNPNPEVMEYIKTNVPKLFYQLFRPLRQIVNPSDFEYSKHMFYNSLNNCGFNISIDMIVKLCTERNGVINGKETT